MRPIVRLFERVSDLVGMIAGVIVLYTIGMIVLNVVARYAFRSPFAWGFDAMVLPMGCAYALAGAYVLRQGAHVNVDILTSRLSKRGRALLRILTSPFLFAFAGALIWAGYHWALRSYAIGETSGGVGWLLYPFKAMLPLGAALLVVLAMLYLLRDVLFVATGDRRWADRRDESDDGRSDDG